LFNEEKSPHPNYDYISSTLCCWQYGHTAKFFTNATCFQLALGWGVGLFEQLRKPFVDCLLAYLETNPNVGGLFFHFCTARETGLLETSPVDGMVVWASYRKADFTGSW
jgi:hypothetical protein